jgi:glutathione S-transferase
MARQLFELVGTDPERRFSPFCWRTRMALTHKGLDTGVIPWRFTEKAAIAPHNSDKVPVLIDGTYPDRPSLFSGEGGRAAGRFLNWWGDVVVIGGIFPFIVADITAHLGKEDHDYFRGSREARFGKTLEEVVADRDSKVAGFRKTLDPMRLTLRSQPFLGGAAPNYNDYIVFGPFQWARAVSTFKLLENADPIYGWRERMLDAFDGLARKVPGYPV